MEKFEVLKIEVGELATNCYICHRGASGFIIDPGGDADKIDIAISKSGISVLGVLLTHGHFDHCLLAKYYQDKGVKVYIHTLDAEKLYSHKNLALMCGIKFPYTKADVLLNDGDSLNIAGINIKVLHTPGHSAGGVCYVIEDENCIFCGDLLFKLSYGRTDFYDGDFNQLVESFKKLFSYKNDFILYPGHGECTTLNYEKKFNEIKLDCEGKFD